MTEITAIEMADPNGKQHASSFWKWIWIGLFLLLVAAVGIYSWWLSNGKISSVAANLDTVVYTVEPEYAARMDEVFVQPGELVSAGQVLGRISRQTSATGQPEAPAQDLGINQRLENASNAEREMAAKVNEAREHEDRLRRIYEDMVGYHVRAQLALRSISVNNPNYPQVAEAEASARHSMERARDDFEKYSRSRAALDKELAKIRAELSRYRAGGRLPRQVPQKVVQAPKVETADLVAPVDGKVLRVQGQQGQQIQRGEPVFLILPTGRNKAADYWIQAWFPENAKGVIDPGQKVNILLGKNGANFSGKVVSVAEKATILPIGDQAAKSLNLYSISREVREKYHAKRYLPVRIALDYPQDAAVFEPGTKAECQIQTRYMFGGLFN